MHMVNIGNLIIRKATVEDLKEVVKVHKQCFLNNFSSQIGKSLLEKFYKTYLIENPDLFLICIYNNKLIGFCMGYLHGEKNLSKLFIKQNFIPFLFRCLILFYPLIKQCCLKSKDFL